MGLPEKIYVRLPGWGQDVAATAYGIYRYWLRNGRDHEALVSEYRQREFWSAELLARWQEAKLKAILTVAADHVPYYRRTWNREERRAAREGHLQALPILEKEPLRLDPDDFDRDDRHPIPRLVSYSSGSSGTPVASHWTLQEFRDARVIREARSARWAGVSFKEPRATMSGRIVIPDPDSKGPFHRFNRIEKQVYFSAFHLSPGNAPQYVEALHRHGTQWLTGYAVAFSLLARYILEQGLEVPRLKAVITTSEKVTPEMRNLMEQAYKCPVFEEYSTVENAVFVSECEEGHLHLSSDAGVMEILRKDGSPCEPGEVGEVVTTSFTRMYQPFVRFRIGDLASWSPEPCPCGRSLPVVQEVVGRVEDVVVGPDGREMVRFHGLFTEQPHVVEAQVIQEALETLRIKVVPSSGFNDDDKADITQRVHQRLGNKVDVLIEIVEEIPRTKAGKFKAVISLLT